MQGQYVHGDKAGKKGGECGQWSLQGRSTTTDPRLSTGDAGKHTQVLHTMNAKQTNTRPRN